jgi:hypothetical protein
MRFMEQKINRIQDDGSKFLIHGSSGIYSALEEVFDNMGLGISVTRGKKANAHILYTENNRDIVLRVLHEHTQ